MTLSQVLQHVPVWVYGLFLALVAFGVSQSRPRRVALRRVTILPAVLLVLSLTGVLSSFGAHAPGLLAWAAGVLAAVVLLHGRVDLRQARYDAGTQRFDLPGSWVPLALMMGLFALKFVVGATLGRHPELAGSATLAGVASAAYGLFSGTFLGRALALWTMARRPGGTSFASAAIAG